MPNPGKKITRIRLSEAMRTQFTENYLSHKYPIDYFLAFYKIKLKTYYMYIRQIEDNGKLTQYLKIGRPSKIVGSVKTFINKSLAQDRKQHYTDIKRKVEENFPNFTVNLCTIGNYLHTQNYGVFACRAMPRLNVGDPANRKHFC